MKKKTTTITITNIPESILYRVKDNFESKWKGFFSDKPSFEKINIDFDAVCPDNISMIAELFASAITCQLFQSSKQNNND